MPHISLLLRKQFIRGVPSAASLLSGHRSGLYLPVNLVKKLLLIKFVFKGAHTRRSRHNVTFLLQCVQIVIPLLLRCRVRVASGFLKWLYNFEQLDVDVLEEFTGAFSD